MRENDGQLFQIELDAMQKSPQLFKELVLGSVSKYYDKTIHEENLEEFTPEKIDDYIEERIRFLDGSQDRA